MDARRVSTYSSVCKAFGYTRRWLLVLASVFSPSTFHKVGRARGTILAHAASVVVDFEVLQFEIPRVLSHRRRSAVSCGSLCWFYTLACPGICVLAFHIQQSWKSDSPVLVLLCWPESVFRAPSHLNACAWCFKRLVAVLAASWTTTSAEEFMRDA